MAEITKIEWVDHTFNPWIGCTRISPACDNCYAAAMSHRRGWARFEARAPRKRTSEAYWKQLRRWNRKAQDAGVRRKVFGPSLADPFDAEVSDAWRDDYVAEIAACDRLDFILLTKRPQVARKYFDRRPVPDNLWPGVTAENQKMLELRAPAILSIAARGHVLSAEPLLEPLDLGAVAAGNDCSGSRRFTWVIAGGESGPKARPSHPDWFRSLRDQCADAGIPFFLKQWGEWRPASGESSGVSAKRVHVWPHMWPMPSPQVMEKVGKKAAGASLDGRVHRAVPLA
jgi:protein gp37